MQFHCSRTNTFCLAAVDVKVNLLHFLRRLNQWRKPTKKFQKFIFWFTCITIQVSGHSPLPIYDFLHPGGLAGDHILEPTLLCPLQQHLQDCLFPQLEIDAFVVLQLILQCWEGPWSCTAQVEHSGLVLEAFAWHVHLVCVWPAKTFGGDCTLSLAIHFNGSNGTAYTRPSKVQNNTHMHLFVHVACPCPSCISMSMLHGMSMLHIRVSLLHVYRISTCTCSCCRGPCWMFMSMLHVHVGWNDVWHYVHIFPDSVLLLMHGHAACPCSMSMLYMAHTCPCCMVLLRVYVAWTFWKNIPHDHATRMSERVA